MAFICKGVILLLSILTLLSIKTCATYSGAGFENKNVKSATFTTKTFEVGHGKIASKSFLDIEFPKGHVGIKSFHAELVDEKGNSVPLYETYLHHFFVLKYHAIDWNVNKTIPKNPLEGAIYIRNNGTCNTFILPYHWGFGGEARGTDAKIPDPYAVEHGNPSNIPFGYQEKWLVNILVIDTRGTQNRKFCTECRCDNLNLPNDFYNVTFGIDGKPLDSSSYKGGMFCCQDNLQCKLQEGFVAPTRKLALRYKITWVDWNQQQIPVRFYILDVTDRVRTNGSQIIHDCQVEFTIPPNDGKNNSPHIMKLNIPMERGGYLIYGTTHMYAGAINATLYGQDGRSLYTAEATYGKGNEPGNEEGYVVKMSGSYPKFGSIKIKDGETVNVETRYESGFRTGAMAQMYIYLADRLPNNTN